MISYSSCMWWQSMVRGESSLLSRNVQKIWRKGLRDGATNGHGEGSRQFALRALGLDPGRRGAPRNAEQPEEAIVDGRLLKKRWHSGWHMFPHLFSSLALEPSSPLPYFGQYLPCFPRPNPPRSSLPYHQLVLPRPYMSRFRRFYRSSGRRYCERCPRRRLHTERSGNGSWLERR
jgi:hypothetical protein